MIDHLQTRRIFLQRSLALLAAGATVPTFIDSTSFALDDPRDGKRTQKPSGKDGKILVVVQLSGGNDGLNSVCPYADDAYQRLRPGLAKGNKDVLKLNDYVGLNGKMTGMKGLYDAGALSVVQGVGYPNPNRSHFRSMDIWQSGIPDKEIVTTGWLGRYFDNTCSGTDPHGNVVGGGIAIGETAPLAMRGELVQPLAFEKPESYRYNGNDREDYKKLNTPDAPAPIAHSPALVPPPKRGNIDRKPDTKIITPDDQLEFLTRTAMDAQVSSDEILRITKTRSGAGDFPRGGFGDGLRTVASMIRGELPTRVYYVSLGGFDTHANQAGRHDNLMQELDQGVAAFWKEMKDQKNDDRVLMMCFSEFGRRVQSNASGGTDHGAAAPMFMLGTGLKQGLVGRHPSLSDLDSGDLKFNIDFRNVYASILEQWLETPSKPVLGGQFKTFPIMKS